MGPVWALLLLLPIAQGAESFCDARQNHTSCYGALGGTMQIRLMESGSTTKRCNWKKKENKIFEWKDKNSIFYYPVQNRSEFFNSTGIFRLSNLSKSDSDLYKLEYVNENGKTIKFLHELTIEAPVRSLHLQPQCLPKGEVQVSWTSEGGDSPEFSCTLNGQNLTDSQLLSKNKENRTITLKQNTEGLLRCSVKNHVSEVNETLQISSCEYINCTSNGTQISEWVFKINDTRCIEQSTTSAPMTSVGKTSVLTPFNNQTYPNTAIGPWYSRYMNIMAGAAAGVLFIGIAAIALFCVLKKKRKNNNDEEQELTYADVRILQQPGRRPQQRSSEVEVEYGQVKFSNQNRPVAETPSDAAIYAQVRR